MRVPLLYNDLKQSLHVHNTCQDILEIFLKSQIFETI